MKSNERRKEGEEKKENKVNLIIAEEQQTGDITFQDLRNYFSYSYGNWSFVIIACIATLASFIQLYSTYYLADWAEKPLEEQQKTKYPIIFVCLVVGLFVGNMVQAITLFQIALTSANNMHTTMI